MFKMGLFLLLLIIRPKSLECIRRYYFKLIRIEGDDSEAKAICLNLFWNASERLSLNACSLLEICELFNSLLLQISIRRLKLLGIVRSSNVFAKGIKVEEEYNNRLMYSPYSEEWAVSPERLCTLFYKDWAIICKVWTWKLSRDQHFNYKKDQVRVKKPVIV